MKKIENGKVEKIKENIKTLLDQKMNEAYKHWNNCDINTLKEVEQDIIKLLNKESIIW